MVNRTMSITAQAGYYVTEVIVACAPNAGGTALTPYECGTWTSGNNLVETYNLSDSTYDSSTGQYTISVNVNSVHFSHNGRTTPNAYFILIQVAKVPTPLFVEYNYGDISKYVTIDSNSNFYDPSKWTDAGSGNSYGSGTAYSSGVKTDDTQFDYQYPTTDTTVIASWKHYANTISDDALDEAAAAGYYFTGWKVTWYNKCSVSTENDGYNNDYTFSFSDVYMNGGDSLIQPGTEVQLPTNVQLIAQWARMTLEVEKVVTIDGEETDLITNSYKINLLKDGEQTNSYTLTDGESQTKTPAPSGTYTMEETNTDGTTLNNEVTGTDGKTYYFDEMSYTSVTLNKNTHTGKITVTNNYTTTPPTKDIKLTKVDATDSTKTLTGAEFTLKNNDTNEFYNATSKTWSSDSDDCTLTVGSDGTLSISGLSVGTTYTLTETRAPDGYNLPTYTWTITVTSSDVSVTGGSTAPTVAEVDGVYTFSIPNNPGVVLPNTGGPGTTLYTLSGLTLLCGALVYGCVLRRRRERRAD